MFQIFYIRQSELQNRDAWIRECALSFCAQNQREPGNASFLVEKSPSGKPYFSDAAGLFLSISHSGDYLALAISDCEIGIDLQIMRFRTISTNEKALKMAKRFFHPTEFAYISCEEAEILPRFFEIWTKKESFVKRTGTGIDDSFSSLNVLNHSFYIEYPFPDYMLAASILPIGSPSASL